MPGTLAASVAPPVAALRGGVRGAAGGTVDAFRRRNSRRTVLALRREGRGGTVTSVTTEDGVRLHVETDGPTDAPFTLVFVHGFSLDLTNFREQRAAFADSGLRSVHFDQRGFGRSPRGVLRGSMRLLAADLAAVLEQEAGGPVVLVGHSMGVMVITALAGLRPELFEPGGRVAGSVLVAGNAGELTTSEFGMGATVGPLLQLVGLRMLVSLGRVPGVDRAATFGIYMGIAGMFMCDVTATRDTLRVCASLISQTDLDVLGEYAQAMYAHDEVASLPVLGRVPCTVLAADHDRFIPEAMTELLAAQVPGATLTVVPDSGHMVPIEHPEVVNDAIRAMVAAVSR